MTDSERAFMVRSAVVGLAVGVVGAAGWHYAIRRLEVIANPPTLRPGDKGFMFTFDYLQYISGPGWWPALLVLPGVGVVLGLVVGLAGWRASRSATQPRTRWVCPALSAAVNGAGVGAAAAILAHLDRPAVLVRIVNESEPALKGRPTYTTSEALWNLKPAQANLWFPIIGALCAALLAVVATRLTNRH